MAKHRQRNWTDKNTDKSRKYLDSSVVAQNKNSKYQDYKSFDNVGDSIECILNKYSDSY